MLRDSDGLVISVFFSVQKFDQGESPEVNGDGALVCRRVIIHPMTG